MFNTPGRAGSECVDGLSPLLEVRMSRDETSQLEAERLSDFHSPALSHGLGGLDLPEDDDYSDPDLDDMNNPDVQSLSEPPLLGGGAPASDMYGQEATTFGRAASPRLWAAASQLPQATQFRVWRYENGVPVALGAIAIDASEEDFVRAFVDSMPRPGEGRAQYRLRPVDIRGHELGKEITQTISEHHLALKTLRSMKREAEMEREGRMGRHGRDGGDIIVQGGGDGGGGYYAEEMGRMFEHAVEAADDRTRMLQDEAIEARDRLRLEQTARFEERIKTAERASSSVEKMTEKLMQSDRARADEAMQSQRSHNNTLLQTMTTVFQQQSTAGREAADRQREVDTRKAEQDRHFFERQRLDTEQRLSRERQEAADKRSAEQQAAEANQAKQAVEWERRRTEDRERAEADRERAADRRKHEMEQMRLDVDRREKDRQGELQRRQQEIEDRRREEERRLDERREEMRRQDDERKAAAVAHQSELARQDLVRQEAEQRRRDQEKSDWERRESVRREEEARQSQQRRDDFQREEAKRREERDRETERRREELALQMKQMETSAQRDREHAERMASSSRDEREAAREKRLNQDKLEREAREFQEKARDRQMQLQVKEMEMSREKDREHQERMMQLSKIQNGGGLTDMLGMEPPELLARIFGGAEDAGGGWADAIPKVLGTLAEVATKTMGSRQPAQAVEAVDQPMVAIQTPQGIKMVPAAAIQARQLAQQARNRAQPAPQERPERPERPETPLPPQDAIVSPEAVAVEEPVSDAVMVGLVEGSRVSTVRRAKAAGLSLGDQRKARRGVRNLVQALGEAPESRWTGILTAAITTHVEIFHYIRSVTAYAALAEVQAEPLLVSRIVAALRSSALIPAGAIPYDEADYAAMAVALNQAEVAEVAEVAVKPAEGEPTETKEHTQTPEKAFAKGESDED